MAGWPDGRIAASPNRRANLSEPNANVATITLLQALARTCLSHRKGDAKPTFERVHQNQLKIGPLLPNNLRGVALPQPDIKATAVQLPVME